MNKILHIFRHGQTDWNLARKMQGHTDIPLNDEGKKQAATLQDYFAQNPVERFFSSDLTRAQQTAQIANLKLKKELTTDARLREVFLGDIEGETQEAIIEKYGQKSWDQWTSHIISEATFTYNNGESATDAIQRFTQALKDICNNTQETKLGICTHGLMIRRFIHSIRPDLTEAVPIPNCAVFKVTWDGNQFSYSQD